MRKIFELEQHIANLIAAGEVVERPASVVKELVENSIDAGAKAITVEINAGGMTYIRITDDGCGMSPEDAKTAFMRHATSKLRSADELESIGTLGFRGEALAAIAAVSRIELLTREPGSQEGFSLSIDGGDNSDASPAGCPEGTTIIVRDLFYNTPARQKFMKTDRAESSAIATVVLRCALSRPDISIRFIKDGKTQCHTPGDSRADSTIYSLFGREFAAGLLPAQSSDEYVSVTGFVSAPQFARGNRSYQFFFINGRAIQSRTLQAALEQAFANSLPSGKFPSCVFYVSTALSFVDVNVHPAKTEVKFLSDKHIFDAVYYAALGAISSPGLTHGNAQQRSTDDSDSASDICPSDGVGNSQDIGGSTSTSDVKGENNGADVSGFGSIPRQNRSSGGGFGTMDAEEFRRAYGLQPANSNNRQLSVKDAGSTVPNSCDCATDDFDMVASNTALAYSAEKPGNYDYNVPILELGATMPVFRLIGEALNTYIIVEYMDSVWMIDKHAAHERIHFDALRSSGYEPMPQMLISPIICRHGNEDAAILTENTELLENLGFYIESFGEDAVAVRQIPSEIDFSDAESALSEICSTLKQGGTPLPSRLDDIYRTIACKASIKAGRSSDMAELLQLATKVMSGEVRECPHGRPVAFEISKTTLDRGFKRI